MGPIMFRHLRESLLLSTKSIPRNKLKFVYDIFLSSIKKISQSSEVEVWTRNSLALDYWEFGVSDIDISIFVDGDIELAYRVWKDVKKYRPLLLGGEIHIYTPESLVLFSNYANHFEIMRDPVLAKKIDLNVDLFADFTKSVLFISKMLESDKGLLRTPQYRQRKWHHHFKTIWIDKSDEFITIETVVNYLSQNCPFNNVYSKQELKHYFLNLPIDENKKRTLDRILYPNRHVWARQEKDLDQHLLTLMTDTSHHFLELMLHWEIWGLSPLTQITSKLSSLQLTQHIDNQRKLTDLLRISSDSKELVHTGFDKLLNYYKPIIHLF